VLGAILQHVEGVWQFSRDSDQGLLKCRCSMWRGCGLMRYVALMLVQGSCHSLGTLQLDPQWPRGEAGLLPLERGHLWVHPYQLVSIDAAP